VRRFFLLALEYPKMHDFLSTLPERTALRLKRLVRRLAGAQAGRRVVVVPGCAPPKLCGEGYHWVTPGGRPVYHPSAYRRAFGRPVYVHSTRRVEVGAMWLAARVFG
jgi:hypothetical protein